MRQWGRNFRGMGLRRLILTTIPRSRSRSIFNSFTKLHPEPRCRWRHHPVATASRLAGHTNRQRRRRGTAAVKVLAVMMLAAAT